MRRSTYDSDEPKTPVGNPSVENIMGALRASGGFVCFMHGAMIGPTVQMRWNPARNAYETITVFNAPGETNKDGELIIETASKDYVAYSPDEFVRYFRGEDDEDPDDLWMLEPLRFKDSAFPQVADIMPDRPEYDDVDETAASDETHWFTTDADDETGETP